MSVYFLTKACTHTLLYTSTTELHILAIQRCSWIKNTYCQAVWPSKEMRSVRGIFHLHGQKPTFDMKKVFCMNWTWLLMTTLLMSWTEGGINGPMGRPWSRSSETLRLSPLPCRETRAASVLFKYQPLPFKRRAMPTSPIGSFKGYYYPSKVELLSKAHGTT